MFWADDDGCYCSEMGGWGAVSCGWCENNNRAAARRDNLEKENKRLRKVLSSPENRVAQYELKLKRLKDQLDTQQKTIQALRNTVESYNKMINASHCLENEIQRFLDQRSKVAIDG